MKVINRKYSIVPNKGCTKGYKSSQQQRESKNKVNRKYNKEQAFFTSCHHRGRFGLNMSPLQIATISALLLACVYLSLGAHIPARREAPTMTAATSAAERTGTEAINAKGQTDDYFKDVYKNEHLSVTATCSAHLVNSTVYTRLQSVANCTSKECMVNVSINLQYLLHMYSHVLGLVYQNSTAETNQTLQLDLLEMMYHRLFSQTQRYLQAHNSSCDHDFVSFTSSEEPRLKCTQDVEVVLCHLRETAIRAMGIIEEENLTLYSYKFCHSVKHVKC